MDYLLEIYEILRNLISPVTVKLAEKKLQSKQWPIPLFIKSNANEMKKVVDPAPPSCHPLCLRSHLQR